MMMVGSQLLRWWIRGMSGMDNPNQAKTCRRYSHRENLKRARQARENFQYLQAMTVRTDAPDSLLVLRQHRQQLRQWRGLMVYWMDAAIEGRRQYQHRKAVEDPLLHRFRFVTGSFVVYNPTVSCQ